MKKIIYTILLTLLVNFVFADGGYCYKYKVKFKLKGDTSITAYYIHPDFDYDARNFTNLNTIISPHGAEEIIVYKRVIILDSLNLRNSYASRKVDQIHIKVCNIISSKIIMCLPCCPEHNKDFKEIDYGYCGTPVIEELTDDEINKLKTEKPKFITYYQECFGIDLQELVIISYNDKISEEWIVERIKERCCDNYMDYQSLNNDYAKVKDFLRSKNIIIFQSGIGN